MLGFNMFVYCSNNPLKCIDPSGCSAVVIDGGVALATVAKYAVMALGAIVLATVISYVESETGVISDTFEGINSLITATIGAIGSAIAEFADSMTKKRDYDDTEKHHIVARIDPRAEPARIILRVSGIGINDPRNLVDMDKGYHRVLHTNGYYTLLNLSILGGYIFNGTEGVEEVLETYKAVLGSLK